MKNEQMEGRLKTEVLEFIQSRKSLQLSTITASGQPYASYAPFAIGDDCLLVLLSDIAVHAENLRCHPQASVLIIEDEDSAQELFARVRLNYSVSSEYIPLSDDRWQQDIDTLAARHGDRIRNLSELEDFKLFRLTPGGGRYVKGFGRAFALKGETLAGDIVDPMRDGHKKREVAEAG